MDLELDLVSESKEGKGGSLAARVTVNCLCSQPVDQKHLFGDSSDRGVDFSDEDEEFASSQDEGEGEVEGSDSEPMLDESGRRGRKSQRVKIPTNARVSFGFDSNLSTLRLLVFTFKFLLRLRK